MESAIAVFVQLIDLTLALLLRYLALPRRGVNRSRDAFPA
jgi:hypothetical protein